MQKHDTPLCGLLPLERIVSPLGALLSGIDERANPRDVEFRRTPLNRTEILASLDREIARLEQARELLAQDKLKTDKRPAPKTEKQGSGAKIPAKKSSPSAKRLRPARPLKKYSPKRIERASGRYEVGRSRGPGKLGGTDDGGYGRERDT
jgi:hypothetical protein